MIEEIVMPFDGKVIDVAYDDQHQPWISVRSICNAIGISFQSQWEKITNDEKFYYQDILMPDARGRKRSLFCIPLGQLNGWLFSINSNKVPDQIKSKLLQYQKETFDILYQHFLPQNLESVPEFFNDWLDVQLVTAVGEKFEYLEGMEQAVLGQAAGMIHRLIHEISTQYGVLPKEIWGAVSERCDLKPLQHAHQEIVSFLRENI
jgi:hypothetical protein